MKRTIIIAAVALAASQTAFAAQSNGTGNLETKTFNYAAPANGLHKVKLEVKVGNVKVSTAPGNKVAITTTAIAGKNMHFIFDWTTGKGNGKLPDGLHLVTTRDGDTLVVSLETGSGNNGDTSSNKDMIIDNPVTGKVEVNSNGRSSPGWKSDWTVTLPARLALHLKEGVGKATVEGLAGGLTAKVGVGKLDVWLPQGPLDANVGVGDINASVHSADYGNVSLSAGVGHVEFYVKGQQNTTGFEQHFTASSQRLSGPGKTEYTLKAGVGHVRLKIGAKRPDVSGSNGQGADAGN